MRPVLGQIGRDETEMSAFMRQSSEELDLGRVQAVLETQSTKVARANQRRRHRHAVLPNELFGLRHSTGRQRVSMKRRRQTMGRVDLARAMFVDGVVVGE